MTSTTVNQAEMEKFKRMAADFWNPAGVYKPLHSMNGLRVSILSEAISSSKVSKSPLSGLRILDVGCGAGLFSEALAREGTELDIVTKSKPPVQ